MVITNIFIYYTLVFIAHIPIYSSNSVRKNIQVFQQYNIKKNRNKGNQIKIINYTAPVITDHNTGNIRLVD